jgi:hypothetical protein
MESAGEDAGESTSEVVANTGEQYAIRKLAIKIH